MTSAELGSGAPPPIDLRPAALCDSDLPFLQLPLGETKAPDVPCGLDAGTHERLAREVTFALMLNTRHAVLGGTAASGPLMVRALTQTFSILETLPADTHPVQRRFVTAKLCFVAGSSLILCEASDADSRPFAEQIARHIELAELAAPVEADPPALRLSARNNHLALRALALIVAARLCGSPSYFAEGRVLLAQYLAGLDERGLFDAETVRGASALWYCNLAVMLLVTAAWIGRNSGVALVLPDQLSRSVEGLGRVIADPASIHRSARRNMYPNPGHGSDPTRLDRGFLAGFHRGRHYLAWVPIYRALFPGVVLDPIFAPTGDAFPWCNEFIGGFADLLLRPRTARP